MEKLLTLKTWFTIEEAVDYLGRIFNESITRKDIYTFHKEHDLTLSFLCIGQVMAKNVRVSRKRELMELPDGTTCLNGEFLKKNCYLISDWSNESYCEYLDGIVDFVPVGCGASTIEEYLLGQEEMIFLDPVYVKTAKEKYYWLVDRLDLPPKPAIKGVITNAINRRTHIPVGAIPDNMQLGIRTSELNLLINRLLNPTNKNALDENQALQQRIAELEAQQASQVQAEPEPQMHTRTANNAAKMIGALAELNQLDLTQPQGQANKIIRETLEKLGSSLGKDKVGEWLKLAHDQLK